MKGGVGLILEDILEQSTMEIYEYDMSVRDEMIGVDRKFPYYVMSYLKQGEALVRIDGVEYITKEKDVIIIPAGVKHDHIKTSEEPAIFLWWHFNLKLYDSIDVLRMLGFPLVFKLKDNSPFEAAFSDYINVARKSISLRNMIYKKAKGLEIMSFLFGAVEDLSDNKRIAAIPKPFNDIVDYVMKRKTVGLSLDELAENFNMNSTYLSNRFKELYGKSPIALHREIIFQRAKLLLTVQNRSVSEVTSMMEFDSISVFSRFFRNKAGMSPSDYKRECNKAMTSKEVI